MKSLLHKNFHILDTVEGGVERKKVFILETWKPHQDIYLMGCAIGLLCVKSDAMEMYLAVSKNPQLEPTKYLVGLKQDWLFYQQRDVYAYSTGINDLMSYHFLPEGHGFHIKKDEPLYIKAAAVNFTPDPKAYDAFCNLYYTLA